MINNCAECEQKSSLWQRQHAPVRIAVATLDLLLYYRTANLCYQFNQGQIILPQFRKIVCLVGAADA